MPERTPRTTRVVTDVMLGRLTTYLRMCGYDAVYALDRDAETDAAVLSLSREEDRLLLTRDVALAARADAAVLLCALEIDDQLRELKRAGFVLSLGVPTRCGRCNGPLVRVETGETPADVPDPETGVWRCRDCGQYYWRGSHWDDVRARLDAL